MRGTYTSSGTFPGWFASSTDVTDDYDIIQWAGAQPWSNGRVGQEGTSYGGINTLKGAAAAPPSLVAIAPQFAFNNAYLDYFYPGGIANDASQSPAPTVQDYRGTSPGEQAATWASHPLDDAFWRQSSVPAQAIDIPTLMIGGWLDYMVRGDIANFKAIQPSKSWLVMGPWEHNAAPPSSLQPLLLAWFDHWLMRRPDAPLPPSRVTSYELSPTGGHGWVQMSDYPNPDQAQMRLAVNTDRTLSPVAGRAGQDTYTVDPHDGPAAICFGQGTCNPAADMRLQDARRLTFTTAPFTRDFVLASGIQIHLRAALSASDGNLVVKVMDVAPTGAVHQLTVGYLKASHRLSQAQLNPVEPRQMADYLISTWPTDWRFNAGDQLRISLTSGDSPKIAADAPTGTVTIATGQGGSYIALDPAGL